MQSLSNIFWLGIKEIRSVAGDKVLMIFLIYSFTYGVYTEAIGSSVDVNNASVGIVDEDRSTLSGRIVNTLFPPYFQEPEYIRADEIDETMNKSRFMFVLNIPPKFERYVTEGRPTEIQLNIDATAMAQAGVGARYISAYIDHEVSRYVNDHDQAPALPVNLSIRRAFNPNGDPVWFGALVALMTPISMLTMILTGAALIREKEHGTIEHLLVMPLRAFEIALAKVWSNSLLILLAVSFALIVVIRHLLNVPIAGSIPLFLSGVSVYLFFATALGIFLGTVTRTMAQFSMLVILVIFVIMMLSGGQSPIESQPEWLQNITFFLPSRHFTAFAEAIIYRGAGVEIVWKSFVMIAVIGFIFFMISLGLFRRTIAGSR
ncbi:ABC transporter permease [Gimesia aquarii]|uniref:Inner membrane transport permease YhhJ n=1 Tax=Gimesia aquarii TaxID=2527964 RepID=A0A517VPA3_9PLAN|nr:ABC transporter permease [Gimesia aquarii]QDT94855.1 Inner membrane transport permease YhhJ [Gimesia aquarii]